MKKILHLFSLVLVIGLSSCFSTLSVRVHSFDMSKMTASMQYNKVQQESQLKSFNYLINSGYFDDVKKVVYNELTKVLEAETSFSKEFIPSILAGVHPRFDPVVDQLQNAAISTRDALTAHLQNENDAAMRKSYDENYSRYLRAKVNLDQYVDSMPNSLGIKNSLDARAKINYQYQQTGLNNGISGTFGTSIGDDDMASFIAKAPEEYWLKYTSRFYNDENNLEKSKEKASSNITKVTTFMGNSDIAIKMDDPGNFVIKGVRLDADAAFRTSFKVLSQGIKYLTYSAGIPSVPASGSGGSAKVVIPEIENFDIYKQQVDSIEKTAQFCTDAFLKIIAANRNDLLSDNTDKRNNAINAVKKAYDFYKSQLATTK